MSVIAFVIERRALKSIRAKGEAPPAPTPRKGEFAPSGEGPTVST
jgi:hypothetical protein